MRNCNVQPMHVNVYSMLFHSHNNAMHSLYSDVCNNVALHALLREEEVVVNDGSEEVIAAGSEGVVGEGRESEGAGRGEGDGEMEEEEHYERAPISQGAATVLNIDG